MPRDYKVGYGKPPRSTRFRKGRSGNPKGRPKKAKNLKIDLVEELGQRVDVREGTERIRISKQRAFLKSLFAKAIKGDPRASALVIKLMAQLLGPDADETAEAPLSADEQEELEVFVKRFLARSPRKK